MSFYHLQDNSTDQVQIHENSDKRANDTKEADQVDDRVHIWGTLIRAYQLCVRNVILTEVNNKKAELDRDN